MPATTPRFWLPRACLFAFALLAFGAKSSCFGDDEPAPTPAPERQVCCLVPGGAYEVLSPQTCAERGGAAVPTQECTPRDAGPDAPPADVSVETAPDTSQPDTTQPDTSKPDTSQPDTVQPDTSQPDTAQPDQGAPDTSVKDSAPDAQQGPCGPCVPSSTNWSAAGMPQAHIEINASPPPVCMSGPGYSPNGAVTVDLVSIDAGYICAGSLDPPWVAVSITPPATVFDAGGYSGFDGIPLHSTTKLVIKNGTDIRTISFVCSDDMLGDIKIVCSGDGGPST
jgi:hypothetical protein